VAAIKFDFKVEMDGGETYVVTADQRDVSKFEMTDFFTTRKHTMFRYLAWAASFRQGKTKLSWEKFSTECVEVNDSKPEGEALDPGQPDHRTVNSLKSSGDPAAG
jgi:hypothetical protein